MKHPLVWLLVLSVVSLGVGGWLEGQTKLKVSQTYATWLPTFTQEVATYEPSGVAGAQGVWRVSRAGKFVLVHRNGVAMAPQIDYTISGTAITFTPAQGSEPDDIILVVMVN